VAVDPYAELESRHRDLLARLKAGQLTQAAFVDQVNALRHCDEQGRWWQISPHTGSWIFYDGTAWKDGVPPRPAPVPGVGAPSGADQASPATGGSPAAGVPAPAAEASGVQSSEAAAGLSAGSVAAGQGVPAGGVVISPQMIEVVKRAMMLDPEAYRLVADDPGWTIPAVVLLLLNSLLVVRIGYGTISQFLQIVYLALMIGGFAGAVAVLFLVGNRFTERRPDALGWLRALALAQIPMFTILIPLIGSLLSCWGLLTFLTAVRGAGGVGWGKAVLLSLGVGLVVGVPLSILHMIVIWLFGASMAAGLGAPATYR
jgi:hypothetical protein